jgi:hypothetical protein
MVTRDGFVFIFVRFFFIATSLSDVNRHADRVLQGPLLQIWNFSKFKVSQTIFQGDLMRLAYVFLLLSLSAPFAFSQTASGTYHLSFGLYCTYCDVNQSFPNECPTGTAPNVQNNVEIDLLADGQPHNEMFGTTYMTAQCSDNRTVRGTVSVTSQTWGGVTTYQIRPAVQFEAGNFASNVVVAYPDNQGNMGSLSVKGPVQTDTDAGKNYTPFMFIQSGNP